MKRFFFGALGALLALVCVPSANAKRLIPKTGYVQEGGLKLITNFFEHEQAAVRIIIQGGVLDETSNKRGVARLTVASLLNPPSTQEGKENIYQLHARLHRLGAKMSYSVGTHSTVITVDAPSVSMNEAFALVISNLTAPSFSRQSVKDALKKIRTEQLIHDSVDNYFSLQRALLPDLFSKGQESRATISDSLTAEDVIRFYREKYQPKNITVVGTGGVRFESLKQVTKSRFLVPMLMDGAGSENQIFVRTSTEPRHPIRNQQYGAVRQLTWGFRGLNGFESPAECMVLGELLRLRAEEALETTLKMKIDVEGGYIFLPDRGYFSLIIRSGGWKGVVSELKKTSSNLASKIKQGDVTRARASLEKRRKKIYFYPQPLADLLVQHVLAGRIDAADYESLENEIETVEISTIEARAKELFTEPNGFMVRFDPIKRR